MHDGRAGTAGGYAANLFGTQEGLYTLSIEGVAMATGVVGTGARQLLRA